MGNRVAKVFTRLTTTVAFALLATTTLVADEGTSASTRAWTCPAVPFAWWVKLVMTPLTGATYEAAPEPSDASTTAAGAVALQTATFGPACPIVEVAALGAVSCSGRRRA